MAAATAVANAKLSGFSDLFRGMRTQHACRGGASVAASVNGPRLLTMVTSNKSQEIRRPVDVVSLFIPFNVEHPEM